MRDNFYHHRVYDNKDRTTSLKKFKWTSLPINNSSDSQYFYANLQELEKEGQYLR